MKHITCSQSNKKPGQRGQSLVELAISLTVILLLLSGAVDFGMAFYSYVALRDAAQEGAFYGSISMDPYNYGQTRNAIIARVRNSSSSPVPLGDVTKVHVTPIIHGAPCQATVLGTTNAIQVTVTYDYPIVMPLLGTVLGSQTIPLTATATDAILAEACP